MVLKLVGTMAILMGIFFLLAGGLYPNPSAAVSIRNFTIGVVFVMTGLATFIHFPKNSSKKSSPADAFS